MVKWTSQNRIKTIWKDQIALDHNYTWDSLWYFCNKTHSWKTSFKLTKKWSFLIKLINNELPILETLYLRDPHNYSDPTCLLCKDSAETRVHLFECKTSKPNREKAWSLTIDHMIDEFQYIQQQREAQDTQQQDIEETTEDETSASPSFTQEEADNKLDKFKTILKLVEIDIFISGNSVLNLSIGLIHKSIHHSMAQLTSRGKPLGYKHARELTRKLQKCFQKSFKTEVWNQRCKKIADLRAIVSPRYSR